MLRKEKAAIPSAVINKISRDRKTTVGNRIAIITENRSAAVKNTFQSLLCPSSFVPASYCNVNILLAILPVNALSCKVEYKFP